MKKLNKILSVGLSLVMCAGMIMPSFAAIDLQQYINNAEHKTGVVYYDDDNNKHEVTYIDLKGVENEDGTTDYEFIMNGDVTTKHTLRVGDGVDIKLNMNGKKLDHDGGEASAIMVTGENSKLEIENGGTITGGNNFAQNGAWIGGGVGVSDGAEFSMTGGSISGNKTGAAGGGVSVQNSTVTLTDVTVSGNNAGTGGGIHVQGKSAATLNNVTIDNNTATAVGGINVIGLIVGGQVQAQAQGTFTMNGGIISNNTATQGAGGMQVSQSNVELNVEMGGVSITGNTTGTSGGGMVIANNNKTKLTGVTVNRNHAGAKFGIGAGGIEVLNSNVELINSKVTGNTSNGAGGGMYLSTSGGGTTTVTMTEGSVVDENTGWKGTASEQTNDLYIMGYDGTNTIVGDTTAQKDGLVFDGWTDLLDANRGVKDPTITVTAGQGEFKQELLNSHWGEPEPTEPTEPPAPVVPGDDAGDDASDETEINDPLVPLASGPITRAQFIDYLWRHEGEPASDGVCTFTDVLEDHEYVLALAWAEQNEVAFAYDDGTFEPDELVTVAAVREFLGNFETVFGKQAVAAASLTTLTDADDEAVLNCDQVLAEFFGEPYELPKELASLEADAAA